MQGAYGLLVWLQDSLHVSAYPKILQVEKSSMIVRVGLIMPSRSIRTQMFGDVVAGAFAWLCLCLIVFFLLFFLYTVYILHQL